MKKIIKALVMPGTENELYFSVGSGREREVTEIKIEGSDDNVLTIKSRARAVDNVQYGQKEDIIESQSFFNIPFFIITRGN